MTYPDAHLALSELTLQWHAGASTIGFEAFHTWALTLLKPHLRFDGAIWGLLADATEPGQTRIGSAHVQGLQSAVLRDLEQARGEELFAARERHVAVNVCMADPEWKANSRAFAREHAHQYGLANSMSMRFTDPNASGQQFILLTRSAAVQRFTAHEMSQWCLLAPHLMQAYATRRKLFLDKPSVGNRKPVAFAVAIVDRGGFVHDQHANFAAMLNREWTGWSGKWLPDPLLELTSRKAGSRWRFLGGQILADFVPIDDQYVVTVRPRHGADALTAREGDIAQRYAAGGNFREVADSLHLAPATVRAHLRNVFGKLQVRNKAQLAAMLR